MSRHARQTYGGISTAGSMPGWPKLLSLNHSIRFPRALLWCQFGIHKSTAPKHENLYARNFRSVLYGAQSVNRWSCGLCKYLWEAPAEPVIDKCPTCASSSVVNLGPVRDTPDDGAGI